MKKQLLKFITFLFVAQFLFHNVTYAQLKNDYGYQGTIEIEVGATKYIPLLDEITDMLSYSTTYYPSGKWVLSNNYYNATMISQSMTGCKVRGDKVGDNVKLTFSGDMILYDAMWAYTGYYIIKVVDSAVKVTSITLSPTSVPLKVGGTQQLTATISPSNATDKSVSWSSNNTNVATVSSSGLVTAKSSGNATITCKANDGSGIQATCAVSVTAVQITDISLDYSALTMSVDDTRRLSVTILPDDASNKNLTWSSSDERIAKMGTIYSTSAEVKAVGPGKAIITCAANDGSGVKATCEVGVTKVKSGTKFTAKTIEGVEMTFYTTNVQGGKCYVSRKSSDEPAVSFNTTGPVTIPEEVEYMKVATIQNNAFQNCKGITKITIPNSVETIESWAFYGCESLKSMTIPDNVIKLGPTVFGSCTSLESVTLGKGITRIEGSMFHSCTALTTISGLEQIVYVGNNAFLGTPWLANQPDGLVYVGKVVVKYNGAMPENTIITIKEGTTMIAGRAFEDQNGLVGINIPESITAIGESAFHDCKNLRSIVIPKQVTEIGSFAFSSCTGLKSIVSHIEEPMAIGKYVFPSYNPDNYIYENATLYVPKGTKTLYEKTEGWNMFKNIVEGEPDPESIKGDVNGDGQVNGTDLVALTNIILGKSSQTKAADVNGDGSVNGTDYVTLVNIILGKSNARTLKRAAGATGLGIEPFDIKAGEEKDLLVNLTNPADEITLVQFDLRLPTGLSLKKADGEYDIDLARTTWKKHSLNANPQSNGTIRFLLASNTNATLTGTEGTVIKMTIKADNSFTSGDIHLENILMVTPDEKERKQETYTYHVGNEVTPTPSTTELAFEPFSIVAGGEAEVSIDLNNPADEITLVQFDLRLPAGLSLKQTDGEYDIDIAGRTTWKKHSLNANPQSNGNIRFLLASNTNATLTGTEGAIIKMTLKADNSFAGGTMKLENILLVTPNEKEVKLADYEIVVPNPNPSSYAFQKTATLENASKYLLVADIDGQLKAATPIASDKTYGYLLCIDVIEENGAINQDDLSNAFTIEATVGGYTIRQSDGRYLFQKSQYDSMNASEEPTEGQVWYVMPNSDGTFRIQNATAAKYVQYSTKYGSYGSYSTEKGIMPSLYVLKSGTSGITSFHTDKNKETSVYNLSGQKLTAPQKGINIINGKKVIVK